MDLRDGGGFVRATVTRGGTVELPEIGVGLPIAALYRDVGPEETVPG